MERVEVLVASTVSGPVTRSSSASTFFFSSMFSNTASTTTSTSFASSAESAPLISPIRCSSCSAVRRPRFTLAS
jgi:hypothetical protein